MIFSATTCHCCSIHKQQLAIIVILVCCINTIIISWGYIVFMNLFYIINCFTEHNLYRFCWYTSKGDKFLYFWAKHVPKIWLGLFSDVSKLIVWFILTIIYIFTILFSNHLIQNELSAATATFVATLVSNNGKSQKLFLRIWQFSFFRIS